jgi:hypothetical protein
MVTAQRGSFAFAALRLRMTRVVAGLRLRMTKKRRSQRSIDGV